MKYSIKKPPHTSTASSASANTSPSFLSTTPQSVPNIGPMTATVVARNNAEVDVDDMGRILVKFAFTRPEDHQGDRFDPHQDEGNPSDTEGRDWTARVRVVQP